ncbi:MAG: alkanesulfonate monooxygenase SsuD [Candidatus Poriferisodalaceae bacterium]|jgi:alkanesulfonate monooxygenase SsuD/methylene tetrahydromethanopterin reductase-like flavin-dependent oxidoreductase (luciferase family)
MKVDANLLIDLADVASAVSEAEADGYSGVWTAEMAHDPFLPMLIAAQNSTDLDIGTSIAVAFARSLMTVANTAWDLQA